jgi:hypothetical protein
VKKIIVFIVLCIYGFSSIGATVHYHYCMNEFEGWSLLQNKDSKCGKCGMKEDAKKSGCCKDEQKEFKLKTDHQKGSIADYVKVFFAPILNVEFTNYTIVSSAVTKLSYHNYHPPPDIHNQNLQVLYCTFLI